MRARGTSIIAAVAIATAAVGGAGAAADDHVDDLIVESAPLADGAINYWTLERLSSATDVDIEVTDTQPETVAVGTDASAPFRVEPTRRPLGLRPFRLTVDAVRVPKPYTNMPDRTVGRVFFTDDRGRNKSCTGVSLASANKSVVWTGGHCVESGAAGGFHTNWIFIPGYGSCGAVCQPFGTFRATKLMTTAGWAEESNFRVDVGAAVVAPNNGRKMTTLLGGQGLLTGVAPTADLAFRNIGYPADPPFEGRRQWMCIGSSTGRDAAVLGDGPDPVAMSCNMAGGASGGPWLTELGRNGYGYVSGVTSYRYRGDRTTVYSPALHDAAAALYRRASTAKVRG